MFQSDCTELSGLQLRTSLASESTHAFSKPKNWEATQDFFVSRPFLSYLFFSEEILLHATHIRFQANYTVRDNKHKADYSILRPGKASSNKQDNFPWSVAHFFFFFFPLDDESLNPYDHQPQKGLKQPLFHPPAFLLPFCHSLIFPAAPSPA